MNAAPNPSTNQTNHQGNYQGSRDTAAKNDESPAAILRDRFSQAVKQIDERWPGLAQLGDQVREHKVAVIVGGSAALLTLAGGIALGVRRAQERNTLSYKFKCGLKQFKNLL